MAEPSHSQTKQSVAGSIIGSKQTERKLTTTSSHLIGYMQCKMQGYILLRTKHVHSWMNTLVFFNYLNNYWGITLSTVSRYMLHHLLMYNYIINSMIETICCQLLEVWNLMAGSTCHQLSGLAQYLNGAEAFFYCLLWIARMEVLCFPVSRSEGWMGSLRASSPR